MFQNAEDNTAASRVPGNQVLRGLHNGTEAGTRCGVECERLYRLGRVPSLFSWIIFLTVFWSIIHTHTHKCTYHMC